MNERGAGPLVAGHQPNFLPWFGYFEKMLKAEIFVYSDDVQYPKQSYTNRVAIPVGRSSTFLTLPVRKGGDLRIADKQYVKDPATCKKLVKTLEINFGGLPCYNDILPILEEFVRAYGVLETVADLNITMNQFIAGLFGIHTPVRRGTELGLEAYHRNERLIERCRVLGSRRYLCGQGADGYQDERMLEAAGIHLERIEYDLGRELFGEDLRYSVLFGIAKFGLGPIRDAVARHSATRESR